MNSQTVKKPKDRIIEASVKLFYDHDANTIGVDKICEVANVSKRTLYKYFPTKENLVASVVSIQAGEWSEAYLDIDSDDPVERITHVFKLLEMNAESPSFHGCHQMNTSIECRDSDTPAKDKAKQFKDELYDYFQQQAVHLKAADPAMLAEQLIVLFDGCNAWIVMRHHFPASVFRTLTMLVDTAR